MAKKKTAKRLCLSAGYAFELVGNGPGSHSRAPVRAGWEKAKDEYWEIVMAGNDPVSVLGRRSIDGSECVVCRVLSGENKGKIMAQTAVMFGKEC